MAESTWDRDLQLLEELAAAELADGDVDPTALADQFGMPRHLVVNTIRAFIEEGFVAGDDISADGLPMLRLHRPRLLAKGRRAVGAWPSNDPFEALLSLVERRIADETDEARKSSLVRFKDDLYGIGKGVAGALLAEFAKTAVGL